MSPYVTLSNTQKWRDPQAAASQSVSMSQNIEKPDQMREIGLRLKATRIALGLTQDEMATSINVGRTTLTNWEKGDRMPDPLAMARLAERYGATMDWIYWGNMSGLQLSLATKIDPLLSKSSRTGG
jgi:DNA-binding XRE family transcriptional regulator